MAQKKRNTVAIIATPELLKHRKPFYENEMCKQVGLMASCNSCDRIIFEDEDTEQYILSGGYCQKCQNEIKLDLKVRSVKEKSLTNGESKHITWICNGFTMDM